MKRYFLPVGLLLAMAIGLLVPSPGVALSGIAIGPITAKTLCILGIFLIMGYQLDPKTLILSRRFFAACSAAFVINLLLAPALAVLLVFLIEQASGQTLDSGLTTGLYIAACVPCTLSSAAVITRVAGGNEAWSLSLIVLLNVLGVFVLPFTLDLCLTSSGIPLDQFAMLLKILLQVITPLLVGQLIRYATGPRKFKLFEYLPSTFVVMIVWMAVSQQQTLLRTLTLPMLLGMAILSFVLHGLLLLLAWGVSRYPLRLDRPELSAILFTSSQKTLPIALTIIMLLDETAPDLASRLGVATVVCIVFHFVQLNVDSLIAARMRIAK